MHADGKADEHWILIKANEILAGTVYASTVIELPLGQLYCLDDEWDARWGRGPTQLREEVRRACQAQLRLAG